jgi:cytochrome c556
MMMRSTLAAAVLTISVATVAAQSDLVRERAELMYNQGEHIYGTLNKMVRGEIAYDQAKVDEAFAKLKAIAPKLSALYPETAKGQAPDADYYASEKVWQNKADFDARLAKLAKDIDANAPKATSLDGLKEARAVIVETCNGCHEVYRLKKS